MTKFQWRAAVGVLAYGLLSCLTLGCSGTVDHFPAGMMPADNEVESWVRVGTPTKLSSDTDLYNQIDGAAPKYIDRGWQGSVYAEYSQAGLLMQVAIYDMGNSDNAQAIFNFDTPVSRVSIGGGSNAVVDMGLPTSYASMAFLGRYYIEVAIDERSDSALASIEAFTAKVLDRNAWATKS
jgi:hypothetical protein